MFFIKEDLTNKTYKELQAIAKENNVKANQKKYVLISELEALFLKQQNDAKIEKMKVHNRTVDVKVRQLNNATSVKLAGRKMSTIKVDKTTHTSNYTKTNMSYLVEAIGKIPGCILISHSESTVIFTHELIRYKICVLHSHIELYQNDVMTEGERSVIIDNEKQIIKHQQIKNILEIPLFERFAYLFNRVQINTKTVNPSKVTENYDIRYWLKRVKFVWYSDYQKQQIEKFFVKYKMPFEITDKDKENCITGETDYKGTKLILKLSKFPKQEISFHIAYEWLYEDKPQPLTTDIRTINPQKYALYLLTNEIINKTNESNSGLASCMVLNHNGRDNMITIGTQQYQIEREINNNRVIDQSTQYKSLAGSVINSSYGVILSPRKRERDLEDPELPEEVRELLQKKRTEKIINKRIEIKQRQENSILHKHFAIASIRNNRHLLDNEDTQKYIDYNGYIQLKSDDNFLGSTVIFKPPGLYYKWDSKHGKSKLDKKFVKFLHDNNIKDHNNRLIGIIALYKKTGITNDARMINVGMLVKKKGNIMFLLFPRFEDISSVLYFLSIHGLRDKQPLCLGKIYVNWQRILPDLELIYPSVMEIITQNNYDLIESLEKKQLPVNDSHYGNAITLFEHEINRKIKDQAYNTPIKIKQ